MKRMLLPVFAAVLFALSCTKDTVTEQYTFFRPVYQTKESVKANIKSGSPQALLSPGKIIVRGNFIFLNDIDRGIHLIDNSNPAQPKAVAFIQIPGCVDLAVNGNYLYADCYTDMVTIDITDPLNISVKQYLNGVFPYRYYSSFKADTSQVIQQWVRVDTSVTRRFSETLNQSKNFGNVLFLNASPSASAVTAGVGIAGSLSRFAQLSNRLYTVSNNDLKVFNTSIASLPSYVKSVNLLNGTIETIFPYGDKLFIGSQSGMFIYDAQNPDQPQKLGQFTHARSCDPVIADGNYAYVTLRGNGSCTGVANELDVVNITNLTSPQMVKIYQLKSPAGLAKDGNLLFICDGTDGLKIFDATNAASVTQVKQIPGFDAYDVVVQNGIAVVVAKDGLYTIDYSNRQNIQQIGKINITKIK